MNLRILLSLSLSTLFLSCGQLKTSSSEGGNSTQVSLQNSSLLFSGIDTRSSPWQSSLFSIDLKEHTVTKLLSGESGDPAVFDSGAEVLFFNRTTDSKNFRYVSVSNTNRNLELSKQQQFAGGTYGDPHDLVSIGKDLVLLANYTEGSLITINSKTGELKSKIEADWDLPSGIKLNPEGLIRFTRPEGDFVYIVHQALGFKDGMMVANGSQRVYVLKIENESVSPVDLDPSTPLIQGIPLFGSFPVALKTIKDSKLTLVSMCSRYIAMAGDLPGGLKCAEAVESIDLKTNKVSLTWDLTAFDGFMNGSVTADASGQAFYANIERDTADNKTIKEVVKFSLDSKTVKIIYQHSDMSMAFWPSFYDGERDLLMIADQGTKTLGKFTIFKNDEKISEIELDHVPYSGVFIH